MRDETRKKLNDHQSGERWQLIAFGGIATVIASAIYLTWTLPFGPAREATGVVRVGWTSTKREQLSRDLKLEVLLDDGRYAVATSTFRNQPAMGSRVLLRDQTNWLGYHHYYWDGLVPEPPKPAQ
jgi:hypothetical protein